MGLELSPEIWGMIAVTSGFGGWIIGNLYSSRTPPHDAVFDGKETYGEETQSLFSLSIAPKVAPARADIANAAANAAIMGAKLCGPSAGLRRPREALVETFPIDEIRAQAQLILRSSNIWKVPGQSERSAILANPTERDAARLLGRYLGSIKELQRANAQKVSAPFRSEQLNKTDPVMDEPRANDRGANECDPPAIPLQSASMRPHANKGR